MSNKINRFYFHIYLLLFFSKVSFNFDIIGKVTSGIYSPKFKKNIGLSMILNEFCETGTEVIVHTPDSKLRKGIVSSLPFKK